VSAREATGVCPVGGRNKIRYRNRRAAMAALQRVRHNLGERGIPPELQPSRYYRCPPKGEGGCGGWHLARDRRAMEERVATLRPLHGRLASA